MAIPYLLTATNNTDTVAVATVAWPYRLGLVIAMLLGIAAAVLTEQRMQTQQGAS